MRQYHRVESVRESEDKQKVPEVAQKPPNTHPEPPNPEAI